MARVVAQLISTGSYVPDLVVTNEQLRQFPANALPLIEAKTGVRARRHAAPGQATSDLGIQAAQRCLASAGIDAAEIDAVILATSAPDQPMPATATTIQHRLGCTRAFAFDLNAVCTGAVYGICLADSLIRSGYASKVLLVGAELYSRFLDPKDFSTYPYFGDGAGALLFEGTTEPKGPWVRGGYLRADGAGAQLIQIRAGGSALPAAQAPESDRFFRMQGRAVFEFATAKGPEVIDQLCAKFKLRKSDLGRLFVHQANINIIKGIAAATGIALERFPVNLDRYGNTACASTLIAIDEARGDSVRCSALDEEFLVVAFGGGLTWGGVSLAPSSAYRADEPSTT